MFGDRQRAYGHPRNDFQRTADLWNGWARAKWADSRFLPNFNAEDVADLMILLKMARLIESTDHRDSMVDIAGYAEARARAVGVDA